MSQLPLPRHPNGWFQIAWSDEIAVGDVRRVSGFGKELVAFRGQSGRLCVLDAYCPHLGAHLGVGGTVEGDTIQCPFHGWRFDEQGACVGVSKAPRTSSTTRLERWPVRERNGLVLVWQHDRRDPPQWEIPELPEPGDAAWTEYCRLRWKIRTHNQELVECAVDRAHLRTLPGAPGIPDQRIEIDGPTLELRQPAILSTAQGPVRGEVVSRSHGVGFGVTRFVGEIETLLLASGLPIDDEQIDLRFSFTVKRPGGDEMTRALHRALVSQIERSMNELRPILEAKRYLARPLLCEGDDPIAQLRRWSEQFYPRPEAADVPSVAAR